jgi:cytochrome P450
MEMALTIWKSFSYRAITRDEAMYPNPEIFDPERFFPPPGVEAQADPTKWIFGFGRRVRARYII